jgi:hypothetical protein
MRDWGLGIGMGVAKRELRNERVGIEDRRLEGVAKREL